MKTIEWFPASVTIGFFVGVLPALILYLITRMEMKLALPLCADHQQERKKLIYGWVIVVVLCIPVAIMLGYAIGSGSSIGSDRGVGWGSLVGFIVFIIALAKTNRARNVLLPIEINESGGRFKKASQAFLSQIPNEAHAVGRVS
jgi:hypothetical protein